MRATDKERRSARLLFGRCLVRGRPDPARIRLVARRLARSGQRTDLAVLTAFRRLVRLDRDRHSAVVESAASLGDDVREDIREGLGRVYGSGLEIQFVENAGLIAGVHIMVGSDVYDGSVKGRLDAIEQRL